MWQALENSGIDFVDWTVRKELASDMPVLHLYVEIVASRGDESELGDRVHECLKQADEGYAHLEGMLGVNPLRVTLLPVGAFERYAGRQLERGADLAHLKPPHINPPDETIGALVGA